MGKYRIKGDPGVFELTDGVHCYTKIVRVKKEQECILCKRVIGKGENALVSQWQEGRARYYVRTYHCASCYEILD